MRNPNKGIVGASLGRVAFSLHTASTRNTQYNPQLSACVAGADITDCVPGRFLRRPARLSGCVNGGLKQVKNCWDTDQQLADKLSPSVLLATFYFYAEPAAALCSSQSGGLASDTAALTSH